MIYVFIEYTLELYNHKNIDVLFYSQIFQLAAILTTPG